MTPTTLVWLALGLMLLHQAGTALLVAQMGRPLVAFLVGGLVFLLYPLWRIARVSGRPADVLGTGPTRFSSYPLATLALLSAMPAAIALGHILVPMSDPFPESLRELVTVNGWGQGLFVVLAVAIVPALAEELLFRGLLQRALLTRLDPIGAIAFSSLAFGLVHGPTPSCKIPISPQPIAAHSLNNAMTKRLKTNLLGILLGWIAYRTNSTRPGIVAHFLANLLAIVGTNTSRFAYDQWSENPTTQDALVGVIITTIWVVAIWASTRGEGEAAPSDSEAN